MKWRRYLVVFVCLAGLVLGSLYVGARLGYETARKRYRQNSNPEAWNVQAMRALERELELSEEQRGRVQAHLDTTVTRLQAIREQTVEQSDRIVGDLFAAVDEELDPRQQVRFRELVKDRVRIANQIRRLEQIEKPLTDPVNAKPGK